MMKGSPKVTGAKTCNAAAVEAKMNEAKANEATTLDAATSAAKASKHTAPDGNTQGRRIVAARRITLSAVLIAVLVSLAFDSGLGTPSSFGIGEFFLLCPLGGLEAMIASRSFIPVAALSMAVVVCLALLFGRAWCAWGCPAPVIRRFFKRNPAPAGSADHTCESTTKESTTKRTGARSLKHIGTDARTWTFLAVVIAAFVAGFPVFCLICPIGLTFGTVGSLWHLIVDKQMTLSVLVFPACLLIELVLYRKWCLNLCPIAGLLGIIGQFAKLFRPRINTATCLRCHDGAHCNACTAACPEHIDLHAPDATVALGECTRCGECAQQCPTASISIKLAPAAQQQASSHADKYFAARKQADKRSPRS